MLHAAGLGGNRRRPLFIAPAEGVHPDAAGKINIFLALHIPGGSVFTSVKRGGKTPVSGHKIGVVLFLYFFKRHQDMPLSYKHPAWSIQHGADAFIAEQLN